MTKPPSIVSSAHLVSAQAPAFSELEFGLTVLNNSFHRWVVRCMGAAGEKGLTALEVLLIHHINHRDRPKRLADICFVLNIEDTHVATYALKKLVTLGYAERTKVGKEVHFSTTPAGATLCRQYSEIREQCLIQVIVESGLAGANASAAEIAQQLRLFASLYDQASRAAASL